MSDAAAFFANKKKKKKTFKGFNANKIDAKSVTNTVHVDAPALSTDTDTAEKAFGALSLGESATTNGAPTNDTWDDEALAAATGGRKAVSTTSASSGSGATGGGGGATTELLDMKALEVKRREQDDVAERMRVEETKAQLAAAKEGMEREAQRLKDEADAKKKKEEDKKAGIATPSPGMGGGMGGRWVPRHLRAGGGGVGGGSMMGGGGMGMQRSRMPGAMNKLDTQDDNMFPDLAAADKIIEQQQQKAAVAYQVPKKTPVGGGASWGSRPALNLKPPTKKAEPAPAPKPAVKAPTMPAPASKPVSKPAAAEPKVEPKPAAAAPKEAAPTAPTPIKKKPTKKKKKDLNTFKAKS